MKYTILAVIALTGSSVGSMPSFQATDSQVQQTQESVVVPSSVLLQEVAPPAAPQEEYPLTPPGIVVQPDSSMVDGVILSDPVAPHVVHASHVPCDVCGCHTCCCEVALNLCLVEPGCGCSYDICVHVPACCVGYEPVVKWRKGLLGRKIAHLCWPCCDKRVKVVVPRIGKVRVWD